MRRIRMRIWGLGLALSMAAGVASARAAIQGAPAPGKNVKYQFKVVEVSGEIDEDNKKVARELLEQELAARPEFSPELGGAGVVAEPGRKGLRTFSVSLKVEQLKKELKEPRPGGRLKQLMVAAKLSIFGAEAPTQKLAFSGDGEAMVEAEIVERRLAEETKPLVHDVLGRAVKEAVDQAVLKLTMPKSEPVNESRRKVRKK